MLSIQTNVNSMNAQENLRMTTDFQARTISRLTSGYRINQSGDDAAGLAVANKFRSDIAELTQGIRNANDGLSTLQIIDGGLNNITKMVDRLKTLATQSASDGYEGDRGTLNNEYTDLLSEIDRQASSVGLGSAAGSSKRYNQDLNIYLGGGGDSVGNSSVKVALGGDENIVTHSGLGLASTNILGGSGQLAGAVGKTHLPGTLTVGQTFTFTVEDGASPVVVTTKSGMTVTDAVKEINAKVGSQGIQAAIVDGDLKFFSDKAYTVDVGAGVAGALVESAGTTEINTTLNYSNAAIANTTAAATFLKVTFSDSTSKEIDISSMTRAAAITKLNDQLNGLGMSVTENVAGDGAHFTSKQSFTVEGKIAAAAYADMGAMTAVAGSRDTGNAENAIAAINTAVAKLCVVQGKVGTAQNKLAYAIQLAQSQITNFSAAESRIRDADVAQEAANLTKAQVLSQASMAALAQANSAPQSVLSLLRG
jgi:flagellin-like hook-associated protein FlgL